MAARKQTLPTVNYGSGAVVGQSSGQEQAFRVSESTLTPCNESHVFEVSQSNLERPSSGGRPMFRRICKPFILLASPLPLVSAVSANPVAPSDSTIALLQKAVDGDWRSAAHKARDQYRHPIETLQFFGLKPDMTVIELQPGGGWYTEILAPVLYAHGHLLEASDPKFADTIKANPAVFGHIGKIIPFDPPKQVRLGVDNSADMVVSFRNHHDWLIDSPDTLAAVFRAVFDVLKPGGV